VGAGLTVGFGRPSVNVTESSGTFMMCLVQVGIAAVDHDINFSALDGTALAGLGMYVGHTELLCIL